MAQPIPFELPPHDPHAELQARLQNAPVEHAEAVLAAYEVLQGLHDRGALDILRAALDSCDSLLKQAVDIAESPEAIRAIRNLMLLAKVIGAIDPQVLRGFTDAVPKAFAQAQAEESKPPGLGKLLSTFLNKDFRRGLAALNDTLVAFGKNLAAKNSEQ